MPLLRRRRPSPQLAARHGQRFGREPLDALMPLAKIRRAVREGVVKVVFKLTYPTGKIYVGKDRFGSARYMGSPNRDLINADFATLPEAQRLDYTIRKEILWQSETATEAELAAKEVEFIRELRSNDPAIGYNRWPRFRPDTAAT